MNEKIGIVTVLYNCEMVLNDFFETLEKQTYKNFELIIIDNNSKDKSLETCKLLANTVSFKCFFIENKENIGVAAGNNQGIKLALEHSCEKILLSNNDIILYENTISNLYERHCFNNVDMSVSKILYAGTNILWYAGGKFDKLKGTTTHFGYGVEDINQYESEKITEYAPTCFMLINSNVFEDIGYMDELYFVYYDDTDFVYRCKRGRKELLYVPSSIVEHKVSFSTGSESDFNIRFMLRNRIYFAKKFNKLPFLYYIVNIIYHFTVRNIKLIKNRHKWNLITKSLKEGWALGNF